MALAVPAPCFSWRRTSVAVWHARAEWVREAKYTLVPPAAVPVLVPVASYVIAFRQLHVYVRVVWATRSCQLAPVAVAFGIPNHLARRRPLRHIISQALTKGCMIAAVTQRAAASREIRLESGIFREAASTRDICSRTAIVI